MTYGILIFVLGGKTQDELETDAETRAEVTELLEQLEQLLTGVSIMQVGILGRFLVIKYGYATEYKKSVHAKCFLNSWHFRGYGPGYGMLFCLFYAILGPECLVDFLFKRFLIIGCVPVYAICRSVLIIVIISLIVYRPGATVTTLGVARALLVQL